MKFDTSNAIRVWDAVPMKCTCGSTKPGMRVRPCRSITRVFGPVHCARTVFSSPTATMVPPLTARARTSGAARLTVTTGPPTKMRSAGPAPESGAAAAGSWSIPATRTTMAHAIRISARDFCDEARHLSGGSCLLRSSWTPPRTCSNSHGFPARITHSCIFDSSTEPWEDVGNVSPSRGLLDQRGASEASSNIPRAGY